MGIEYISYHVCLNPCIVYRGKYKDNDMFIMWAWQVLEIKKKGEAHGLHKVLKSIPIIPRMKRILSCKEWIMLQRWHALHISEPRITHIVVESITMKNIEDTWPSKFKDKEQIFWLSISMDGLKFSYLVLEFIGPCILYILHGYRIHWHPHNSWLTSMRGMPPLKHS